MIMLPYSKGICRIWLLCHMIYTVHNLTWLGADSKQSLQWRHMASWRLKSLETAMFVQHLVQGNIKENTKALHFWLFEWETTGDQRNHWAIFKAIAYRWSSLVAMIWSQEDMNQAIYIAPGHCVRWWTWLRTTNKRLWPTVEVIGDWWADFWGRKLFCDVSKCRRGYCLRWCISGRYHGITLTELSCCAFISIFSWRQLGWNYIISVLLLLLPIISKWKLQRMHIP